MTALVGEKAPPTCARTRTAHVYGVGLSRFVDMAVAFFYSRWSMRGYYVVWPCFYYHYPPPALCERLVNGLHMLKKYFTSAKQSRTRVSMYLVLREAIPHTNPCVIRSIAQHTLPGESGLIRETQTRRDMTRNRKSPSLRFGFSSGSIKRLAANVYLGHFQINSYYDPILIAHKS